MDTTIERIMSGHDETHGGAELVRALRDALCEVLVVAEGQDGWRDINPGILVGPPGLPGGVAVEATRKLRVELEQLRARCNGVEEKLRKARGEIAAIRESAASAIDGHASLTKQLADEKRARQSDLAVAEAERARLAAQLGDYPKLVEKNRKLQEAIDSKDRALKIALDSEVALARKLAEKVPWWSSKDVDLTRNALLIAELVSGNEKIVEACADKTAPIESLPVEHPSHAAHEAVKALKIRYNRALEAKSDLAWACGMAICVCEGRDGWQNVAEPDERAGTSAIRAAKVLRMKLDEIRKERDELKERLSSVGSSAQSFEVDVKVSPETEARLRHDFVSKLAGELHVVRIRNGGWTSPDESLREAEAIWEDSKPKPKVVAEPIKLGDIVIMDPAFPVRTVSVPMTVEKIEGNQVSTFWFVGLTRETGIFFDFQLVKANT